MTTPRQDTVISKVLAIVIERCKADGFKAPKNTNGWEHEYDITGEETEEDIDIVAGFVMDEYYEEAAERNYYRGTCTGFESPSLQDEGRELHSFENY